MKTKQLAVLVLLVGLLMATTAQAALFRVGPNDVPSPPGNGYPFWYQDTLGVALDLCIPTTVNQLDPCVLAPLPGAPPPTLPFSFPNNWLDEFFWYGADATLDFDGANSALLVQAVEAAFGGGPPAIGDQITFSRIRIRIDAPVDGNYTVTYPYGEQVFPNVTAGIKAINVTSDVGIGAPGDFSGALKGAIGPFLIPVTPPVVIDGGTFLSDGITPVPVTGSPFGNNIFRVCVDNPAGLDGQGTLCMETNLFTVFGKVHLQAIGSPLTLDRATYARNAGAAHVDVFATASAGPGAATPTLSFGDAAGTNLMPSKLMNGPTNLGQYFGQSIPTSARAIPATVIVTNVADNPPSSITRTLVDEVIISRANYNPATGTLTITATSSDKGDNTAAPAIVAPQLFAIGLPGSVTGSDGLSPVAGSTDPAQQEITYTIPAPLPTGGPVPPFAVTVISSAGGQDSEVVSSGAGGAFRVGGPIAVADSVALTAGSVAATTVNVLQNDVGTNPATVRIVTQGKNGSAVANPTTGVVTYTFIDNTFVGDDVFTYSARSAVAPAGLPSNVATVTITTSAGAGGPAPSAVSDGPFSVGAGLQLQITAANLTANDLSNGGTLNPASIQIVAGSVTGGTAVVNAATGNVTYTAGATAGNFGFSYTVANTNGQRSAPAAVSITVLSNAETLNITAATFRTGNRRWDVTGTSTVPGPGNTITVSLLRGGVNRGVIGSVAVDALGAWNLRVIGSNVVAQNGDQVLATSTGGKTATLAVRVRN